MRNLTGHNWNHLKSTLNPSCILWGHWIVLESQDGLQMLRWAKSEQTKKCGEVYWTFPWSPVCVQILPENEKTKCTDCVTMSLSPYVMWLLVAAAIAHSDIVTIGWMILSNAWHGLQRLARKRSFHRLVWHSGCCLSFNGHKREILQDTIEVIWSLLSILPAFCEGTDLCFGKPSRLTNAPVGSKRTNQKVWGGLLNISMVSSMCEHFDKERKRNNALTVSLCHYVPMWCDFLFQQPFHIVTISWMILSNAWHGLQRLAKKRSFHRLVRHSCCCLSFNDHKCEILQDTIEIIWSLLSILPAFCEGTELFWKAKSVDNAPVG